MESVLSKKYFKLTQAELKQSVGGAKWQVVETYYSKKHTDQQDENGYIHWAVRTVEQKFHNNGTPFEPPVFRNDK